MQGRHSRRKRKIPEQLGNGVCGIWPHVAAIAFNAAVHVFLFFLYGQTLFFFIRLFLSFIFFIYPMYYVTDTLWSLRPSVCNILSGRLQINRKYYMNSVQKEVAREALLPVTVSVPVYMEKNEVLFETLKGGLAAARRYRLYSGKEANVVVSDDGLAPLLGGACTEEKAARVIRDFLNAPEGLSRQEQKAAQRLLFYREQGIAFVARPESGRAGLFKKSSNLNYTLRIGRAVSDGHPIDLLIRKGCVFEDGYAEGDITTNEIILLLDKDSGVKERIIEAILPEFAADEKLAYVQCATSAVNLYENYYTYATGHQTNNLFHNIWPCKALQGFFVPLVGHNVFLRKSILEKSGLWAEDKVSEDYDKAIRFYGMGYHGKYAQLKGLEFTEYVSRTFTEETGKQRRYAYGLFEMIFDGTLTRGKTRGCDVFFMLLYFCSVINQVMLLPTMLLECYFGNIHLLWAGFLFCNLCFLFLPLLRRLIMSRRQIREYSEKFIYTVIIAISFVGHSYSFLMGACRFLANKVRKNRTPFPSTSVDQLEYRFVNGAKLLAAYLRKNLWFPVLVFFCLERVVFMLTRRWLEPVTTITYCYILFCVVFVPLLLTPQLFAGFPGKHTARRIREGRALNDTGANLYRSSRKKGRRPFTWRSESGAYSPRILDETRESHLAESDVERFLESYHQTLQASIPKEDMPKELLSAYSFESCLRKDAEGKKEIYLLRRRKDGVKALLRITKDYPEEDAIEEAKLLKRLDHPGIPKVDAFFEQGQRRYIVRDYIEGRSLQEIISAGGPLAPKDIFGIVVKLTDILSYLHSQTPPVIHRDIKPENIIVAKDGSIHLIDFGIARVHNEKRTQDTSVVLTLDYASPEQYGFEQTTPLSDIYSLGVVMLFLATGRTERSGLEAQVVNNRLRNLIGQCIAFNPDERLQSVEEIRDYILADRSQGTVKRRKTLAAAAVLAAALLCLSGLSYGAGYLTEKSRVRNAEYERGYEVGYTDGYDAAPAFPAGEEQPDPDRGNSAGNAATDGGAFALQSGNLVYYIAEGDISTACPPTARKRSFWYGTAPPLP